MKNKLSVAVVGCRFNHPFSERVLSMWRTLADKYKVEVNIITTDRWIDKKGDTPIEETKYLKVHKLFTIGAQHGQFKHMMPSLPFLLMELKPNFIYAQEEPIQMGVTWPAYFTAKYIGKPFMFFTWENLYQKWFFPIGAVEDQIIRGSDVLIAGTEDSKKILIKKHANPKKIVVLPETGIDTQFFKPATKHKPVRTILYIGRLVPEKGIDVLLKAREILRKRRKYYRYIFVGEGPMTSKIASLMEKHDDVILKRPVPYAEVPSMYHLGNVFFYASLRTKKWEEQYGYSMLEALSSGLPVISTKGISGPEAIVKDGENGFLIPEDDAVYLADKLQLLMEKPKKLELMSKNAREDAIKRLSKEAVAKQTYDLLKRVAKDGTNRKKKN